MAKKCKKDPKLIQLILDNAKDVLRVSKDFLITRDLNGIVAANSGIDQSNYFHKDFAVLLPKNSNKSAKKISLDLKKILNKDISVIITDSVGRPWRNGLTQIALGSFGIPSIISYEKDLYDSPLFDTDIPIVDELCSTAGILMIKDKGIPVVIIRGYNYSFIKQGLRNIIRSEKNDIFK
jgi:coenzyme F420-0:L-glutamate ligase/coenzyme F420-1:gamma-L-glutamate ligase